ncbi:MAG TPA: SagB family peptide dehydrogenase [Vicinamibacterales bacterium]|nr:SagB family peptide dehydrogenase [Vicinamibacterales bacterium]
MFWRNGAAVAADAMRPGEYPLTRLHLRVLTALTYALSRDEIAARCPGAARGDLAASVRYLRSAGLIVRVPSPASARAASAWDDWLPAAGLLHFGTKASRPRSVEEEFADVRRRLEAMPSPPGARSRRPAGRVIALSPFPTTGSLPEVLLQRRSWRSFGSGSLAHSALSTLLGLTWAVQKWMRVRPRVRQPLRTSPSGGACHSIETYVVANRVSRLAKGIYRYQPDEHVLEPIRRGLTRDAIVRYLGGQPWFRGAAALFVMTSVIPRVAWKYPTPRAYRVLLLEAGHFCQTFCLVATWLGLAPFCTAAFADGLVERAIGVDGVNETAIYVAGVGARPQDVAWAPWPRGYKTPHIEPPAHARRSGPKQRRSR